MDDENKSEAAPELAAMTAIEPTPMSEAQMLVADQYPSMNYTDPEEIPYFRATKAHVEQLQAECGYMNVKRVADRVNMTIGQVRAAAMENAKGSAGG